MSDDGEMVDLVVRGLTREEVYRWAGRDDSDEDYCVLLALAARRQVAEWEREERDATSYTDGAESFRRHLRVASVDDPASVSIEVEMEEISGESHADIDVPWARLLPLLNRVREQRGLPRLVEELPSDPLRLDIGAAEFAAAVGATDVHAALAEVRALGERATKLGPAEKADDDCPGGDGHLFDGGRCIYCGAPDGYDEPGPEFREVPAKQRQRCGHVPPAGGAACELEPGHAGWHRETGRGHEFGWPPSTQDDRATNRPHVQRRTGR